MKSSKWADFFVIGSAKNKREVLFPQTDDTTTAVYFRVCESLNSRECCCTSLPHCPKSLCTVQPASLLGSPSLICVSEAIIQEGRNGGRLESAPRLVGGSGRMRQRPSHLTPLLPVVPSVTILPFNKCHKQRFTPSLLCSALPIPSHGIYSQIKWPESSLDPVSPHYRALCPLARRPAKVACMHARWSASHFLLLGLKSLLWRERERCINVTGHGQGDIKLLETIGNIGRSALASPSIRSPASVEIHLHFPRPAQVSPARQMV